MEEIRVDAPDMKNAFGINDGMSISPACPVCGARVAETIDSRLSARGTERRRRRLCPNNHRFTTYERYGPRPRLTFVPDFQI